MLPTSELRLRLQQEGSAPSKTPPVARPLSWTAQRQDLHLDALAMLSEQPKWLPERRARNRGGGCQPRCPWDRMLQRLF